MTTINGFHSPMADITYGTAQGSILGPLVFILYVNDIFKSFEKHSEVYMCADDTLLISKVNNVSEVTMKSQKAPLKLSTWCEANKLSINLGKTKYMIIKHVKTNDPQNIVINNNVINKISQYEYLGLTLKDKLSMNEYLDVIWKKTNAKIGILAKIRRFISTKTAT